MSVLAGMAMNDGILKGGGVGVCGAGMIGAGNPFFYFQVKKGANTHGT